MVFKLSPRPEKYCIDLQITPYLVDLRRKSSIIFALKRYQTLVTRITSGESNALKKIRKDLTKDAKDRGSHCKVKSPAELDFIGIDGLPSHRSKIIGSKVFQNVRISLNNRILKELEMFVHCSTINS